MLSDKEKLIIAATIIESAPFSELERITLLQNFSKAFKVDDRSSLYFKLHDEEQQLRRIIEGINKGVTIYQGNLTDLSFREKYCFYITRLDYLSLPEEITTGIGLFFVKLFKLNNSSFDNFSEDIQNQQDQTRDYIKYIKTKK